ncbi:MAG: LPS-assembly lipoprotein LptE [Betaproteobacteria bacterium]|jgi:LPS-assembly lipoprotein|nr:MAG: LPS-assembly lipoprotein LptE [Betaproteobacteria bacterium]
MRALISVMLALMLAACGFQLRGAQPLPFSSLYVPADSWETGALLKRNIRALNSTQLTETPQEAQAVFTLLGEAREKNILSLSGTGRVREYQLRYRLAFRVHDLKGREFIAPTEIVLVRDISFSDERVLAKEQEEALLYRDMQNDMVQQLMRRMAAAKVSG